MLLHCPPTHPLSTWSPFAASHRPRPHPSTWSNPEIAFPRLRYNSHTINHTKVTLSYFSLHTSRSSSRESRGPRPATALASDCHISRAPAPLLLTKYAKRSTLQETHLLKTHKLCSRGSNALISCIMHPDRGWHRKSSFSLLVDFACMILHIATHVVLWPRLCWGEHDAHCSHRVQYLPPR